MSTLEEIKSKYGLSNDGAVTISVDVEALREIAKGILEDAQSFASDVSDKSRAISSDLVWQRQRRTRISSRINEQKRNVGMAQKLIGEVSDILDKANENIAKVK
jgi:hypothetical protein